MALELPVVSSVVARLANPEIELAAYGSVIWPIALVIEAPIIMLLSASTALSRDRASYQTLARFARRAGAVLTLLHLVIALTPLYEIVVGGWIGAPEAVMQAARPGFVLMTPWTWSIAYRRFNQGVLIRFGHNHAVTIGTMLRAAANFSVLGLGYLFAADQIAGSTLAGAAVATGVLTEAAYSGLRVRPVVREHLRHDDPEHAPLRGGAFARFYVPLALTTIVALITQPIAAAGVARMPEALPSLATLPVVVGLVFMHQALGLALTEIVVAGLEVPGAERALARFTGLLAAGTGGVLLLICATPISGLWFGEVSGLAPELVELGEQALWWAIPIPVFRAIQSLLSGSFVHARRTGPVSEAVLVFLVVASGVIFVGIATQRWLGLSVAMAGMSIGRAAQAAWMWGRWRRIVGQRAAAHAGG
jgi:hypothetical protein